MTRRSIVAAAFLMAGCADPISPARGPAVPGVTSPFAEVGAAPSLILVAPGQLVTLELASGETKPAWFQAEIFVREPNGAAQMDGAILVVSAADGPMPQSSPNAETLSIDVESAVLGSDGVVRFEGLATLTDPSGRRRKFDFSGSLTPRSACCFGPDWLIYDIVGGEADGDYRLQALMRVAPVS
jgi:hypothetical protein